MLAAGAWQTAADDLPSAGLAYRLVGASSRFDVANRGDGWEIGAPADGLPTCVISGDDSPLALFLMGRTTSPIPLQDLRHGTRRGYDLQAVVS